MSLFFIFIVTCLSTATAIASPPDKPLALPQAIDYALTNNPEMAIMQARLAQAQNQLGIAMANYYPQIKVGMSYQHSNNPAEVFAMLISQRRLNFAGADFNHPGSGDNYRPQVSASYSLYRGGQDYHQSQSAELGITASELDQTAVRNRLINHITATYYGQLSARESQKVSERAVEALQSELEQSQKRYQAGTLLKSDVLSLQVQLSEAKEAQIESANAIEMANATLKTLLGMSISDRLAIQESFTKALPKTPSKLDALITKAIAQNPELQATEKRAEMAKQQLAVAKGAYLPRADAIISYGTNSKNFEYSTNRDNVSIGVQVEMDIFNGMATQEKVRKAEHELTAAQQTVRQQRLKIENEVKGAQLKLQEALNRADVADLSVQAAEEALRLVKEQRQAGVVTVTRYIEAEVARDRARTRQISARYDALRAEAELNLATGSY